MNALNPMSSKWYQFEGSEEIPSPALVIFQQRVAKNIEHMISIVGGPDRLCPHVKTYKLAEIVKMQMESGIRKFKCSTVAEAEMVAGCGAEDVLLAYQPVGPNVERMTRLARTYPALRFGVIVDNKDSIRSIAEACVDSGVTLDLFIDLDVGMHRSGIAPGSGALELAEMIRELPSVAMGGLHVYDGHLGVASVERRRTECRQAMKPVLRLLCEMRERGIEVPRIVAGGTPTFPIHAEDSDFECSPGTCLLWDFGYGDAYRDLPFLHAAGLLTRVVSLPTKGRICLDLGHKAVAAEKPAPHVRFPELPDGREVLQNEEHLVLESERAGEFRIGDLLFGIPVHICPTCALYSEAIVVEGGRIVDGWRVVARERRLTV